MSRYLILLAGLAACASAPVPASTTPARPAPVTGPAPAPLADDGALAGLVMRMYIDDREVRAGAARALGAMGARAAPALPELVRCAAAEPDDEPTAICAAAIAAISHEDPAALPPALAIPLEIKERALAALAEVGRPAVPGAAAVYLDACTRAARSSEPAVRQHLEATAAAAIAVLARQPAHAIEILGPGDGCARRGADRIRSVARR
jgi:hypothetical protein